MNKESFVQYALDEFDDNVELDIEESDDGKYFVQAVMRIPTEVCHRCGPEIKDLMEEKIKSNPLEFIDKMFGPSFKNVDWGQTENECLKVLFDNNTLVVDLNFECEMD